MSSKFPCWFFRISWRLDDSSEKIFISVLTHQPRNFFWSSQHFRFKIKLLITLTKEVFGRRSLVDRALTGTGLWIGTKVAVQTLHCYCVCCELLSASIADALLFVNILVSGIFQGRFAQWLAVNKPCLQILRRLFWKQTTTHSIRNNNPMFDQQPLTLFFCPSQ